MTNGIIVSYQIQRALVVSGNISGFPSNVSAVPAAAARVFSDTSVRPYTTYAYRVVAFTVAGGTPSPFRTIRTGEGGELRFVTWTPRHCVFDVTSVGQDLFKRLGECTLLNLGASDWVEQLEAGLPWAVLLFTIRRHVVEMPCTHWFFDSRHSIGELSFL